MKVTRLKDGKYRARWREGGRQKWKTFHSAEAARYFERQFWLRKEAPELAHETEQTRETFRDFAERWYREHCLVEKAESQHVDDRSILDVHLLPAFGEVPLKDLKADHLISLRAELKARGRKPKTINNVRGLAVKILNDAQELGRLAANPFQKVRRLKRQKPETQFWIPAERDRFLAFTKAYDPELYEVALFTTHTGLRAGEVAGLTRGCLSFERRRIIVKQAWCQKSGKPVEHTKGHMIREVPFNPAIEALLATRRGKAQDQIVFPVLADREMAHMARWVKRVAKRAGVKPINFHALRHTFSACYLLAGGSIFKLTKLLGHADVKITFDNYGHLHDSGLDGATDILVSVGDVRGSVEKPARVRKDRVKAERVTGLEPSQGADLKLVRNR